MWVPSLCREDPLEEEMASHSSTLTGKFRGQRSLEVLVQGVAKSRTRTSTTSRHTHTSLLYAFQFFSLLEEILFQILGNFLCPFIIDMLWTFPPHFKMFFPNSSSQRMDCRLLSVPWPSFSGPGKSNLLDFHDNTKMLSALFTKLTVALMGQRPSWVKPL